MSSDDARTLTHSRFIDLQDDRSHHPRVSHFNVVPQRTPEWFKLRRGVALTGSKLSSLMFLNTVEELRQCRDEILGKIPRPPMDELGKQRCAWGTKHEPDGIQSLLDFDHKVTVLEVGFIKHAQLPFIGASPDGIVHWPGKLPGDYGVLEVKCCTKTNKDGKTVPHAQLPWYYLLQVYFECRCTNLNSAVFVSWGEMGTNIWIHKFDPVLWSMIYEVVGEFYYGKIKHEKWFMLVKSLKIVLRNVSQKLKPINHGT